MTRDWRRWPGGGDAARRAAIFAAETALRRNPVDEPVVTEILGALARSDVSAALNRRAEHADLTERLDDVHFTKAAESGPRSTDIVIGAFRRARAASALLSALDPNVVDAAVDAIYEAQRHCRTTRPSRSWSRQRRCSARSRRNDRRPRHGLT